MIDILGTVKTVGIKTIGKVKKVSPEILLVAGTATVLTGIVFACKKTKKAEEIIEEHIDIRNTINEVEVGTVYESEGEQHTYSKKDRNEDIAKLYFKTAKDLVKIYALPTALIVGGFSMIFAGFGIVKKRNTQLMAACAALSEAFNNYKKKVKEELGEDKERYLRFNAKEVEKETEVETKDGKKKTKKEKILTYSDLINDPYAKCFDETNPNWRKDNAYNKTFLLTVQNWANDLLNSRPGNFVLLNEVYDMLGFDLTATGAVSGWVKGVGDDYISFGVEKGVMEANRAFNRGEEPSIWLDFNVDGYIIPYLPE